MQSKLISSFFTVFIFWWTILFFATPNKGFDLLTQFLKGWAFSAIAAVFGFIVVFMLYWLSKEDRKQRLEPSVFRGMNLTLGTIPLVSKLKRNNLWSIPSEFSAWHTAYKKDFPKHAALLNAGISIMKANPCQASPVKGGHGDVNLLTHSYNVLREIISMAPSWDFKGSVGSGGNILLGLTDSQFVFNSSDPVIPLVAFLHDLGKIVCYKTQRDGSIKQVLDNHDIHGGKLIINIDEFWELSKADRDLLILSITYYHHPSEMPLWADDRTRAVMELMIKSDNEAGKKEGGVTYYSDSTFKSENDDADATNTPLIRTIVSEDGSKIKVNEKNEIINGGFVGDRLYKGLRSLLSEPDRINGRDHAGRIGFKANGYVYLQEERLRQALASSMDEPSLLSQQLQGGINPNTTALMEKLDSLGVLYVEHNGHVFGPGSAFWNTVHKDKAGKVLLEPKYVIIIKSEIFPGLDNMNDCPAPPEIVKPSQGWKRARNKDKSTQINVDNIDKDVVEVGVPVISFDNIEDINSPLELDASDLRLLMKEAKETESEDIEQFKINADLMSSLLDEDEVVDTRKLPVIADVLPMQNLEAASIITASALLLLDDDEPELVIKAESVAAQSAAAYQEMSDELDEVELDLIHKLHTGKVGFETPFKKKTYEGIDYFMYAIIILKGDYVNDWDYFLSQVKRGEIPDVIWKESVQKDIYLGFKGK